MLASAFNLRADIIARASDADRQQLGSIFCEDEDEGGTGGEYGTGNNNDNNNNNNNIARRPISIVPEIRREFRNDPKAAIQNNTGLHFDPAALDRLEPEVAQIADAHAKQAEIATLLHNNPDWRFISLLKGMTRDPTLSTSNVTASNAPRAVQLTQSPAAIANLARLANTNGVSGFFSPNNNPVLAPLLAQLNRGTADEQRAQATLAQTRERLQVLENIDSVMGEPAVSGIVAMSHTLSAAIQSAIASLVLIDRRKFANKTRFAFYKHETIMVRFAELVRAFILLNSRDFSDTYVKRDDVPRAKFETVRTSRALAKECVWDSQLQAFVLATEEEESDATTKALDCLLRAYIG
jgi:hypothetical protein